MVNTTYRQSNYIVIITIYAADKLCANALYPITTGFVHRFISGYIFSDFLIAYLIHIYICIFSEANHILFTLFYNKIKDRDMREGFALIPFISIGMMAVFFI